MTELNKMKNSSSQLNEFLSRRGAGWGYYRLIKRLLARYVEHIGL